MRKAVIGLVVVGITVWWWNRPPFPSFPMEVTVDLIVDGQDVRLNTVVKCEYDEFRQGIGSGVSYTITPNPQAFGQKMPSGGVVIVATPAACDLSEHTNRTYRTGQAFRPIREDYVPLILWMPDTSEPGVLHAYVSPEALKPGQSRIAFQRIKVEPATRRPDPQGDFDWLKTAGNQEFDFGYATRFVVVADEYEWSLVPELAQELESISTNTRIELGPNTTQHLFDHESLNLDFDIDLRRMLAGYGLQSGDQSNGHFENTLGISGAMNRMFPLVYENDALRLDMSRQGILVLYRTRPNPVIPIEQTIKIFGVQVSLGGQSFVMGYEVMNPYYFPEQRLVVNINQSKLFLSPEGSRRFD